MQKIINVLKNSVIFLVDMFRPELKKIDYKKRLNAIKKMKNIDEDILANIAINDSSQEVSCAAIERIKSEDILANIAMNAAEYYGQKAAISKISSNNLLCDVADKLKEEGVLTCYDALVLKLDPNNSKQKHYYIGFVKELIKEFKEGGSEFKASSLCSFITSIKSQHNILLAEIATQYPYKAYDVLTDYNKEEIYKKIEDAVKSLDIKYHKKLLVEIFWNSCFLGLSRIALSKIDDQETLSTMAKNSSDKRLRLEAVQKLSIEETLVDIAKNDSNLEVRRAAFEKLDMKKYANLSHKITKEEQLQEKRNELMEKRNELMTELIYIKTEKIIPMLYSVTYDGKTQYEMERDIDNFVTDFKEMFRDFPISNATMKPYLDPLAMLFTFNFKGDDSIVEMVHPIVIQLLINNNFKGSEQGTIILKRK